MKNLLARFVKDESGAAAIEYALIAALIALAIVGGATALGSGISRYVMLHGLIQHHIYHAGQISLLRKA